MTDSATSGASASPALEEPVVVGYPDRKGVRVQRVTYPNNRAQTVIAANLFLPPDLDPNAKHPAVLVGPPFLGVKEQTAGLHAQLLAERGFIALAFDPSHYGDSSGDVRFLEDPGTRIEDLSAGIDFLSNHPLIDPERIGLLGICGSGGYSIAVTQIEHRIKALATVSMFDLGHARRNGLDEDISDEFRMQLLDRVGQ